MTNAEIKEMLLRLIEALDALEPPKEEPAKASAAIQLVIDADSFKASIREHLTKGRDAEVRNMLDHYGAKNIKGVPADKYAEALEMLRG